MSDRIMEFNNQGVAFIEGGCYSHAKVMLRGAFQILVERFEENNTKEDCLHQQQQHQQQHIHHQQQQQQHHQQQQQHMHHQQQRGSAVANPPIGSDDAENRTNDESGGVATKNCSSYIHQTRGHPEIEEARNLLDFTRRMAREGTPLPSSSTSTNATLSARFPPPPQVKSSSSGSLQEQQQEELARRNQGYQENAAIITLCSDPIKITAADFPFLNSSSSDNADAYSCVVLFNYALASHLLALVGLPPSTEQERRFLEAKQLYQMAKDAASAWDTQDELENVDTHCSSMILLASLNNICRIYHSDLGGCMRHCEEHQYVRRHLFDLEACIEWLRDYAGTMGFQDMWYSVSINLMTLRQTLCSSAA